jgi:tetratricopeptide (TPR) repeat protein
MTTPGEDAPPTSPEKPLAAAPPAQQHKRRRRRIIVLFCLLAASAAALPVSRRLLLRPVPPPPPASAGAAARAQYLNARIAADPTDTAAYLELARIDERNGYYMSALRRLEEAQALGLPSARAAGVRGRCWMQLGRLEEARAALEEAAAADPSSADAAADLATLHQMAGRDRDAVRVLEFFLSHQPALLSGAYNGPPASLERLAVMFGGLNRPERALQLAERLIAATPEDPAGYVLAGQSLLLMDRASEAAARLEKAADLAPGIAGVHYAYGMALSRVPGQQERAAKQWQITVTLDERYADAYFELGREYERKKDWRRAATAYTLASDRGAEGTEAAALAARMWARLGNREAAALYGARAAAARGDNKTALKRYLWLAQHADPTWRQQGIEGAAKIYHTLRQFREYIAFVRKTADRGTAEDFLRVADAYGDLSDWTNRAVFLKRRSPKTRRSPPMSITSWA